MDPTELGPGRDLREILDRLNRAFGDFGDRDEKQRYDDHDVTITKRFYDMAEGSTSIENVEGLGDEIWYFMLCINKRLQSIPGYDKDQQKSWLGGLCWFRDFYVAMGDSISEKGDPQPQKRVCYLTALAEMHGLVWTCLTEHNVEFYLMQRHTEFRRIELTFDKALTAVHELHHFDSYRLKTIYASASFKFAVAPTAYEENKAYDNLKDTLEELVKEAAKINHQSIGSEERAILGDLGTLSSKSMTRIQKRWPDGPDLPRVETVPDFYSLLQELGFSILPAHPVDS